MSVVEGPLAFESIRFHSCPMLRYDETARFALKRCPYAADI